MPISVPYTPNLSASSFIYESIVTRCQLPLTEVLAIWLESRYDITCLKEYFLFRPFFMSSFLTLMATLTIFMHKYEVMVLPFTCGHTVVFHTSQAEKHSFPEWKLHSHRKLSIGQEKCLFLRRYCFKKSGAGPSVKHYFRITSRYIT